MTINFWDISLPGISPYDEFPYRKLCNRAKELEHLAELRKYMKSRGILF